jgi:WD40 repeat protein
MQVWKTLKVFVSSTFKDLELERDRLAQVFHNIKENIFARQLSLIPYDLRWRDRHQGEDIVKWCLDMLDRCQYFVGILGYRYGWRPPFDRDGKVNQSRMSVTEMEFRQAMATMPRERRFFCLGDIKSYGTAELASESQEDIQAVEKLKQELITRGETVYTYSNFNELLTIIERELENRIDHDYDPARKVPPEIYTRKAALASVVAEKQRGFVGREQYVAALNDFAVKDSAPSYLAIHAVAGTGKSSLLARFLELWRQNHADVPVLAHYLGMGGDSREVNGILASLGEQLQELGTIEGELDSDPAHMRMQVRKALESYTGKLVVVLDGLDEVAEAGQNLMWLPPNLPTNIRMIVSARPGQALERLSTYPACQTLALPPLSDAEIAEIVRGYNETHKLRLSEQDQLLLQKRAAGNPLFLKVALDEILSSGMAVGQLASTIEALFDQILTRLKKTYGAEILEDYLGFIAAGRMGVAEAELRELLVWQGSKLSPEFLRKVNQTLDRFVAPIEKLEQEYGSETVSDYLGFVACSRCGVPEDEMRNLLAAPKTSKVSDDFLAKVHKALDNFVIVRGGLLTFFHPEFERSIQMWLGKSRMRHYHRRFSDYLRDKGYTYPRTLSELPYQEQWGERYEDLLRLLSDLEFLEKKCTAGMANQLSEDFQRALHEGAVAVPATLRVARGNTMVSRDTLRLLDKAFTHSLPFVRSHPDLLFQTLWNYAYWYDCEEAARHYQPLGESQGMPPWQRSGDKVAKLLQEWRKQKEANPGFCWLESRRPLIPIGSALLKTLSGHEDEVTSVAFGRHGHVASGSKDRTVRIWDAMSGECVRTLKGHEKPVSGVAFSPDGNRLASASWDKTVRLWDAGNGECLRVLTGHQEAVTAVCFTNDGKHLVSASEDMTLRLWQLDIAECVAKWSGHKEAVTCLACSPNGLFIASGAEDHAVHIWEIASGTCKHVLISHLNWVRGVAFSPDARLLASAAEDNTTKVWDVQNGKLLYTITAQGMQLEENLDTAPAGEGEPKVIIRKGNQQSQDTVTCLSFSPDGTKLCIGSSDKTVHVWDMKRECYVNTWSGHDKSLASLCFSQDGRYLASASSDRMVRIWDVGSDESHWAIVAHKDRITSVATSGDGSRIASGSYDQTVRVWDSESGLCLWTLSGHKDLISGVAFSPDDVRLATASFDNTVRLWNMQSGKLQCVLEGHGHAVHDAIFSPDGQKLVSTSADRTMKVWEVASGKCLQTLTGHKREVRHLVFSHQGKLLASASKDNTVRLWDVESGQCLQVWEGHQREVLAVTFSPDNMLIASASEDNTVRLWDVQSGNPLGILTGHSKLVFGVAFTNDGKRLISVSEDGTARMWEVASGKCLEVKQGIFHAQELANSQLAWQVARTAAGEMSLTHKSGQATLYFPEIIQEAILAKNNILAGGNRQGYVYVLKVNG